LASIYSLWLLYAAGWQYLFMSTILFALGLPVYWYAKREREPGKPAFTAGEKVAAVVLVLAAILAIVLFMNGTVSFG
ncbi:MAG TPA: arginine:agmatine antiporter, partial [Candidatus Binatia bacterium]|nr:arginine:agmatine antiporter [Candidatus Binatia bacterium]